MADQPLTSWWNSSNDPDGTNRKRLVRTKRYAAYRKTFNRFKKTVDNAKGIMKDDVLEANRIALEELYELEIQLNQEKLNGVVAGNEAGPLISEDIALHISKDKETLEALRPFKEATLETLGSSLPIVEPQLGPALADSGIPLINSSGPDLAVPSSKASATLGDTEVVSVSKPGDNGQDKENRVVTSSIPCRTCAVSKGLPVSVTKPKKHSRGSNRTDRSIPNPSKRRRMAPKESEAPREEESPAVVLFEIEDCILLNGPLLDNHFINIPKSVVPVNLRLFDNMQDIMLRYEGVKVRADNAGWCIDFGFGVPGQLRARKCFEGLKGMSLGRYDLKMNLYEYNNRKVDSTL